MIVMLNPVLFPYLDTGLGSREIVSQSNANRALNDQLPRRSFSDANSTANTVVPCERDL